MKLSVQRLRDRLLRHLAVMFVLALGGLQVAAAEHADAHDSLEPDHTCGVCVQLEQYGDAVAVEPAAPPAGVSDSVEVTKPREIIVGSRLSFRTARAPPVI